MKKLIKFVSVLLCFSVMICMCATEAFAVSKSDLDKLKKQKESDKKNLDQITAKINSLSTKISENNKKINGINSKISANNAEIKKNEAETEADKLAFKKRIRSIYMSNSESQVKVLLGAKSFSQFLQLSQLTSAVSSHDEKLMKDLAEKIKVLNEKNAENEELLKQQQAIKAELNAQYAELSSQQSQAKKIYDKSSQDLDTAQKAYDAEQAAIARRASQGGSGGVFTPSFTGTKGFVWPSNFYYISAGFQSNDSVHKGKHDGIDIAGSGIMGTPIKAIADGYVSYVSNTCSHNYGKSRGCGCGGNYGNYCQINHGTIEGKTYSAIYAHATKITVSPGQFVKKGQTIGTVGTTGWSTGPHLHFGLLVNGSFVNPLNYF